MAKTVVVGTACSIGDADSASTTAAVVVVVLVIVVIVPDL